MKKLFYYCLDQEILDLTKVLEKFRYDYVVNKFEIELKLLTLILDAEDTISFSPSALFESEVCRHMFVTFSESFESGLFTVVTSEKSLHDNLEKKRANYETMCEIEKYKIAYFSKHPKGLFQMEPIFIEKNTTTGINSFSTWRDGITEDRINLSGIDTGKFNDFLIRLSNSEKKAFLWESVEIQAATIGLSAKDLELFRIRKEMSAAYLDTYAKAGFLLPVNGFACFSEKPKGVYFDINKIKRVIYQLGFDRNFLIGKSVSQINKIRNRLFQTSEYQGMCSLLFDSDDMALPKSIFQNFSDLASRLVEKPNINNNINISGISIMNSSHINNVTAGIVGAIGTSSKAENNTFQQVYTASSFDVDLLALAEELKALKVYLRQRANDDEHDRSVVSIGLAEAAARTGKHGDVISHLKSAGQWVLDIASEVSSAVAVKAIETAMGL